MGPKSRLVVMMTGMPRVLAVRARPITAFLNSTGLWSRTHSASPPLVVDEQHHRVLRSRRGHWTLVHGERHGRFPFDADGGYGRAAGDISTAVSCGEVEQDRGRRLLSSVTSGLFVSVSPPVPTAMSPKPPHSLSRMPAVPEPCQPRPDAAVHRGTQFGALPAGATYDDARPGSRDGYPERPRPGWRGRSRRVPARRSRPDGSGG